MADTLTMDEEPLPESVFVTDPMVGLELQGYVITGPVSSGGMGVVYEGRHTLIGRRAAVKVLRPELGLDSAVTERFLREARAVSAIKHRNVVEILNFGALPDGAPYMMMEFLEGETLAQIIAREAPMRPLQALRICKEILSGLAAAHQVGVIHRDLKPANIILMRQSTGELIVKVLDFGLAKQVDASAVAAFPDAVGGARLEKSSLLAGTPEYINPEQAAGDQVGAQGDLYSLGVILFEMLSGKVPFQSSHPDQLLEMHRTLPAPRLGTVLANVDPALEAFVSQLLAKLPEARPSSARAALETVERLEHLADASHLADTLHLERDHRAARRLRWVPRIAVLIGTLGLFGLGLTAAAVPPELLDPADTPTPALTKVRVTAAAAGERPLRPAAVAGELCEDAGWRRSVSDQVEDLEKLTLARLPSDPIPSEVARIKARARALSSAVRGARGGKCVEVQRQMQAWRIGLRSP